MVWMRVLLTVATVCMFSATGWASKVKGVQGVMSQLKQLPVINKAVEGGVLQKVAMAAVVLGLTCTSIGCSSKLKHEERYDLARAERRKLTRTDRYHIQQYVNGLLPVQKRDYSTYVHVDNKYRNTRQRVIYEGDAVYFLQDGGVYHGVVERHVHPKRVIIGELQGTGIYDNLGVQKRMVDVDAILGVSLHHDDMGLMLVMENDDMIFRRDDDDYFARFHARVVDVYDDGFYRLLVEYGTDTRGNRIYLQDSYTLFSHRNMWREHSVPLANHADIGVGAIILGPAGTDVEYLIGTVSRVYNDGYYRLKIKYGTAAGGFWVDLRDPYVVFMHKNIWPMEGRAIEGHRDVGRRVLILGEEGSNIEYLLGKVKKVMDDGFYDIEIHSKRDFQGNRIRLAETYHVYVHEDTPARQGGMVTWFKMD